MFEVCVVYLTRVVECAEGSRAEVLLGRKLTGFGADRLVGPGGKLEPGESARDAAVREVREETGLEVAADDLVPIAEIAYPFIDRPHWSQFSWAFTASVFGGELRATDELDPHWFALDALPLDRMWADAALWVPRALAGQYVAATLTFGSGDAVVAQHWGEARRT
jgi:8-oxo-dGTP diphosphatase